MNKISGALLGCALGVSLYAGVSTVTKGSKVESKPVEAQERIVEHVRLLKGSPIKPSGAGTSADPFRIGTIEELEWFRNDNNSQSKANNRKKCAKLTNDIDLEGSSTNKWVSIGNADNRDFRGTFDGDGYTIYNFYQDGSSEYSGLFGHLKGTVKNLSMRGYLSTPSYGGSFVGCAYEGSNISNCINYIDVHAGKMGAGVAYFAMGTTFSRCVNYGHITGDEIAGIINNANTGNRFEYCVNYGRIEGQGEAGGIVGSTSTGNSFYNNYNVGQITSTKNKWACVGGICAETTNGTFRTNHNVGSVTQNSGQYNYKGAIVGKYNNAGGGVDGVNNYYRTGSCTSDNANATAIAVGDYTTQANFDGFDFDSIWRMGPECPVLRYKFSSGDGSANNPYIVKSLEDLVHVADDLSASYKLGHSINTFGDESHTWKPIGNETTPFLGSFDGNGYTISNLYIKNTTNNADPVGLFGTTAAGSTVKNVKVKGTVTNENTTNNLKNATGAVVGHAEGKIYKCEVDANVTGEYRVGGIVGILGNSVSTYTQEAIPSVEQCSSKGSVSVQESMAGGLVGSSYGPISESYNVASVTGVGTSSEQVGGIVGVMNNPNSSATSGISHCHNQGEVSAYKFIGSIVGQNHANISSTYYLENTSIAKIGGTTSVNGGVGGDGMPTDVNTTHLTAAEAKDPSSYVGWDFENIWMKGRAYPVFFDAVEQTIVAIEDIGAVVYTEECKGRINAARTLYNALSSADKALVTNYADLEAAEVALTELAIDRIDLGEYTLENKGKIDEANALYNGLSTAEKGNVNEEKAELLVNSIAVYNTQNAIENIPDPFEYTSEFKAKIDSARSQYDGLASDELRALITNYNKLLAAEASWKETDDSAKANAVEDLIDAIGDVVYTPECEANIDAAQNGYSALTDDQKALVDSGKVEALDSAVQEYNTMDKIEHIGTVELTEPCKTRIDEARDAYDQLTEAEKAVISNYETLVSAENIYDSMSKINSIGTVEHTNECKEKIVEARESYDALSENEQEKVQNIDTLLAAEVEFTHLSIDAIGEVSLTDASKESIDEARAFYNSLSEEQKAEISEEELKVLTDAEADYKSLSDNAIADSIEAMIDAIGEVSLTEASKERIKAARDLYEKLSEDQKALVDNFDKLVKAEEDYAKAVESHKTGVALGITFGIIGGIILLIGGTWALLMFVFNKWIKVEDKIVRAFKLFGLKKDGKPLVWGFPFKFVTREESEIFNTKEEALK